MFKIFWLNKGEWFSTSEVYNPYGLTQSGIDRVKNEISKGKKWWNNPSITYTVYFDDTNVTEYFI